MDVYVVLKHVGTYDDYTCDLVGAGTSLEVARRVADDKEGAPLRFVVDPLQEGRWTASAGRNKLYDLVVYEVARLQLRRR